MSCARHTSFSMKTFISTSLLLAGILGNVACTPTGLVEYKGVAICDNPQQDTPTQREALLLIDFQAQEAYFGVGDEQGSAFVVNAVEALSISGNQMIFDLTFNINAGEAAEVSATLTQNGADYEGTMAFGADDCTITLTPTPN